MVKKLVLFGAKAIMKELMERDSDPGDDFSLADRSKMENALESLSKPEGISLGYDFRKKRFTLRFFKKL